MRRAVICATLALLLVAPGQSAAHGVVSRTGTVLSYSAIDDQRGSRLKITSPRRGIIRLSDRGTPGGIVWGPCIPASQYAADCGGQNLTRIEITLGAADDEVTARISVPLTVEAAGGDDRVSGGYERNVIGGGPGDDTMIGGSGGNSIVGDSGSDTIDVRNGGPDPFSCGTGFDTVAADPSDSVPVLFECESVSVAPGSPDTRAPTVRLGRDPVTLSRRPKFEASLDEPGTIRLAGKLLIGRRLAGKLGDAIARPDAPGQVWTMRPRIRARLTSRASRALSRGKRVRAALRLTARDRAGNARRTRALVRLRD